MNQNKTKIPPTENQKETIQIKHNENKNIKTQTKQLRKSQIKNKPQNKHNIIETYTKTLNTQNKTYKQKEPNENKINNLTKTKRGTSNISKQNTKPQAKIKQNKYKKQTNTNQKRNKIKTKHDQI